MGISEQISGIIVQRKSRLPEIQNKINEMEEMCSVLSQLEDMKNQMIDADGEVRTNGKYADLLLENPEMAWKLHALDIHTCKDAILRANQILADVKKRFSREHISISVIGEARRGKSAFLKSISGLNDLVIPAFESTDCTGAPSIIYNQTGSTTFAKLTFKTGRQMVQMAQVYINKIISDESKRYYLNTMADIKHLNMRDIKERADKGSADGIYLKYLEKMITHYDDWAQYADEREPLILYDEHEIASFVAQNNGIPVGKMGRKEYYKYLVVEKCEITCSFPQQDAGNINLIDTVGLGDHTIGILESMLQTVKERSDAVIFMIMPQNGAGGGIPQSVKEIYGQIVESCRDKKLEDWLFYLINHVEQPNGVYAVNTAFCESALHMLQDSGYFGSEHAKIINALDEQAVRTEFLAPLLESLTGNLKHIDKIYIDEAQEALNAVSAEYQTLCTKIQKVLLSDLTRNIRMIPLINNLTVESKNTLRSELFALMNEWLERRNQPCNKIYHCASDILDRMVQDRRSDSYLPSQVDILEQLSTGIQPPILYTNYLNEIRNAISKDFLNVNVELKQFVDEMKNDVASVLAQTCQFSLLRPVNENRPIYEWLDDFSKHVLGEDTVYPNIKLAVDTLRQFEFSVKGFLTYEIRNCLDELDPRLANIPYLVAKDNNLKKTAANIQNTLLQRLCDIADTLEKVLRDLCIKPNRALFAEVIEFYDRIIYAEGVDMEWNNFYQEKATILWSDNIKKIQNVSILCQDWMDLAETLQQYNASATFQIKE